jgi:hypothetical protein
MALIPGTPAALAAVRGRGGLAPRRPDQGYEPPRNTIAPGQAGIFRGRQVVISGSGAGVGLFEYNGVPGPGNPPVAWATPSGVTVDPFGNALPVSGGFAAKGGNGVVQLNGAAILFALTGAVFGGAAVMTAPIPPSTGVPGLLFTSPSDINSGSLDSQAAFGLVGRSADGLSGPFIWLGSTQAGSSNILAIKTILIGRLGFGAGGVPGGGLTSDTDLYRSAAKVLRTDTAFALSSQALPASIPTAAVQYADGPANLRFVGGGDGINYATGSFRVSMANPQTSAAGFSEVDGFGIGVGSETYIFDCVISGLKNTSAGTAVIAITGPAINYAMLSVKVYDATTGAFLSHAKLASLTSFTTPSIPSGDSFTIEITGSISFSGTGFFQVQMANGSAATWQANAGSYFSLKPV